MEKLIAINCFAEWLENGEFHSEADDQIYNLLMNGMHDPDIEQFTPDRIEFIGENGSKITLKTPFTPEQISFIVYAGWIDKSETGQEEDGIFYTTTSDEIDVLILEGFYNRNGFGWPPDKIEFIHEQTILYYEFE